MTGRAVVSRLYVEPEYVERIKSAYPRLSKAERRAADVVLSTADVVVSLPLTRVAREAEVSEATLVRLCHSLGYQGYRDFRLAVVRDLSSHRFRNVPADIHEDDNSQEIVSKVRQTLAAAIERTAAAQDEKALERAINAIVQAHSIGLYGTGGSGTIARTAHYLFMKAGFHCDVFDDGYMMAVAATLLSPQDVAIGISHSGTTKQVVDALSRAAANGATTIAITSVPASPLAAAATITLLTSSYEIPCYGEFIEARVGQLYLIDVLYLGAILRQPGRAARALDLTAGVAAEQKTRPANGPPLRPVMDVTVESD